MRIAQLVIALSVLGQSGAMLADNSAAQALLHHGLEQARVRGDVEKMQELICAGADADYEGGAPLTLLMQACMEQDFAWAQWLLEHGATINFISSRVSYPPTPLICAIEKGDVALVALLLESGANPNLDVNTQDRAPRWVPSPLLIAVEKEEGAIVRLLLEHGASVDQVASKIRGGNLELLRVLAEHGVTFAQSNALLCDAAIKQDLEMLAFLVQQGVDLDKPCQYQTPLAHASADGAAKSVQFLLDHGADIEYQSATGMTALIAAALGGHTDIVKLLLERGAQLPTPEQRTLLCVVVMSDKTNVRLEQLGSAFHCITRCAQELGIGQG